MKALIFVDDGVEDLEFFYPFYRLKEQGIEVDVAGFRPDTFIGKHGYEISANLSLSETQSDEYDIVILPGGKAPETLRTHPAVIQLVKDAFEKDRIVAAICHGPQILISADVLEGRKATCYKGIRDDVIAAGATYLDQSVVVDGNLITSRTPDDLPDFCRAIFATIKK